MALLFGAEASAAPPVVPGAGGASGDHRAFVEYREQLDRIMAADRAASEQGTAAAGAAGAAATPVPSTCGLYAPGAAVAPAEQCATCHRGTFGVTHTHPVDIEYDAARYRPGASSLRTSEEVVRRGVLLPDGKIRCATCHDGRSTWKYKLALPPGAPLRPAVNLANRSTYEQERRPAPSRTMPAGSDVSPTPLCKACHNFD